MHTCTHSHIYTHILAQSHTCTHTCIQSHTLTLNPPHSCTIPHAHTHTFILICTHNTHIHSHTHPPHPCTIPHAHTHSHSHTSRLGQSDGLQYPNLSSSFWNGQCRDLVWHLPLAESQAEFPLYSALQRGQESPGPRWLPLPSCPGPAAQRDATVHGELVWAVGSRRSPGHVLPQTRRRAERQVHTR